MKKGRTFYSLLAFLTVAVLLCILFFSGFTVLADGTVNLKDKYSISTLLTMSDFDFNDNGFVPNGHDPWVADLLRNDLLTIPSGSNDFDYSTDNYVWTYFTNQTSIVRPVSSGSFMVVQDYEWGFDLYYNVTGIDLSDPSNFYDVTAAIFGISGFTQFSGYSLNKTTLCTVGDSNFLVFESRSSSFLVIDSNIPIYSGSLGVVPSSLGDDLNPNTSSGGSDQGESSLNNLYLQDGYFVWSTPSTGYYKENWAGSLLPNYDNWFRGTVTWYYELTDYQKLHPDEFRFKFTSRVNYYVGSLINSGKYTFFGYYDSYGGQVEYVDFSSIVDRTTYSFTIGHFMQGFLDWFTGNSQFDYLKSREIDVSNSIFTLNIKVEVVNVDDKTSTDYTDELNFINNSVKNKSKGITNNNYPYTGTNGDDLPTPTDASYTNQTGFGDLPTANNNGVGTSNTSGNNINIVNNNNRLIDPKPVVDYTKNEILPNENDTNYVGLLETVTHEDGFINLLSTTFSFVPVTVWNALSHYFTIMLTMIVAFFALRLILDIL